VVGVAAVVGSAVSVGTAVATACVGDSVGGMVVASGGEAVPQPDSAKIPNSNQKSIL
jgi:hypothetical protein